MTVAAPETGAERTLLAWRRTVLGVAVGFLLGARLLFEELGAVAVVGGLVGIALALAAYLAASVRYRRARRAIDGERRVPRGGAGFALLAGSVALLAATGVAFVAVYAT